MGLSEREQRVCDLIRRRETALREDLRLHVGLPTGGGNTAALDETRERLTSRAKAMGAVVTIEPGRVNAPWRYGLNADSQPTPTAICRRNAVGAGRELLIAGHLDTVHDPAGTFRELTVASDGKTAVGPGCVDMKGGLVIALAAMEALEEVGEKLNWTLLLNSDEETGSYASSWTVEDESRRVAEADGLGIALEPATPDGGLVIERAGSGQFMFEARGRAAHVGREFASGVSAVALLCEAITQALALSRPADGVIVNIGPLQGGNATNVVPDLARAWGNARFPTAEAARKLENDLIDIAGRLTKLPPPPHVVCFHHFLRPAKPLTPEVQQFADLIRAAATDLGQKLPFSKTAGVCDGNLMQAAGLPTLDTLGVRGGGLHTPQEWIELSSLVQRCQLLAITMMRASRR
jgi:glutamate carboxypeptidase